jgi:hypothetical protein
MFYAEQLSLDEETILLGPKLEVAALIPREDSSPH